MVRLVHWNIHPNLGFVHRYHEPGGFGNNIKFLCVFSHVDGEGALDGKLPVADAAGVWFRTRVGQHMVGEGVVGGKRFGAGGTVVGFLTRMGTHVHVEVTLYGKITGADGAGVGFLTRMATPVCLEMGVLLECFGANVAWKPHGFEFGSGTSADG